MKKRITIENCFEDMIRDKIEKHTARIKKNCVTKEELTQALEIYREVVGQELGYPALQIIREEAK